MQQREHLPSAADDAAEVMASFRQGQKQDRNSKLVKSVTKTLIFLLTLVALALTTYFIG